MNRELLRKLYDAAVAECDKQEAWQFEEEFTKQIIARVRRHMAPEDFHELLWDFGLYPSQLPR